MSDQKYEDILYEEVDGVATITFNRAEKLNAFRMRTYGEVIDALHRAGWSKAIGVIVLTGAGGRAFCVGGDSSDKKQGCGNFSRLPYWPPSAMNSTPPCSSRVNVMSQSCFAISEDLVNVRNMSLKI